MLLPADEDQQPTMGLYAVLGGDVAVMLEPAGSGWRFSGIPARERAVISARYPARRLQFPDEPEHAAWRGREAPQAVPTSRINLVYAGAARAAIAARRGGLLPGDWDREVWAEDFGQTVYFQALRDRFARGYEAQAQTAASPGALPADPGAAQDGADIQVAISREGRYVLIDGAPRLAVARLLHRETVSVQVVARHPGWEEFRERLVLFAGRRRGRIYQRILHPDLADLRADHDFDDRLPLIEKAFAGYATDGKRLVDIGAHWGQMSMAMEQLGFDVTAVEANPKSARIANRLRTATESRYPVWEGSIFEFDAIADQDVVLALNIFHHFLKSEESHANLISLLQRSEPEMIVFAAHSYGRGTDFEGAYRDYPPEVFARFVSEHSGLPQIQTLGRTYDGRTLYKIHR